MKENKKVYVVVGDIGGTKEVLPALFPLRDGEAELSVFADPAGKGQDILTKAGIPFDMRGPAEGDAPDVIAIGTSATAVALQILWTRFGKRKGIPVVWVEDLHGTGERDVTRMVDPDVLCAIDGIAATIARTVRPDIRVEVCGKPSFGPLAELVNGRDEVRVRIRTRLEVASDETLVTFFSGGESAERLRIHVATLIPAVKEGTRLAARFHPKLPSDALAESYAALQHAGIALTPHEATLKTDANELTVASDILVCDWGSTQGYVGVLAGVPTLVTLFPSMDEEIARLGYPGGRPPLVSADAAIGIKSPAMLRGAIEMLSGTIEESRQDVLRRREPFLPLIRKDAAERIAAVILGATR